MKHAMSSSVLRIGATVLFLGLASCIDDPFEREGTWQPAGVNDRKLRAIIADPEDLERGSAALRERGAAGSNAATRLLTEQRRPLPAVARLPRELHDECARKRGFLG